MRIFIVLLLSFFISKYACSQLFENALPFVSNYGEKEMMVSVDNWDMVQGKKGTVYFANNYGVLEFDGKNWNIIQIAPNKTNIRSLVFDKNNRLFVGAQGVIGYLATNDNNEILFYSLNELIPEEYRNFSDVWKTFSSSNEIVFHTQNATFVYDYTKINAINHLGHARNAFQLGNNIYIHKADSLYLLKNNKLIPHIHTPTKILGTIVFLLPYSVTENGDELYIVGTESNELFLLGKNILKEFPEPDSDFYSSIRINCGIVLKNKNIAIGTQQNGIIILDKEGNLVKHLNKKTGLQSNEIRRFMLDRTDNLWVANAKGVDYIEMSTPFRYMQIDENDDMSVYSAKIYNNKLYAATHRGLFVKNINDNLSFSKVKTSNYINWNLELYNNSLFLSYVNGVDIITKNTVKSFFKGKGVWTVKKTANSNEFIVGAYNGVFRVNSNGEAKQIKNLDMSCRIIEFDIDSSIWTSHGYKGVCNLKLNSANVIDNKIKLYNSKNGLPSDIFNRVFKIDDEIVFGTEKGVYRYNAKKDSMEIHPKYSSLLGTDAHIRFLTNDLEGNVWFIKGNKTGVIRKMDDGSYKIKTDLFNRFNKYYNLGFENLVFTDDNEVVFGMKNGLLINNSIQNSFGDKSFNCFFKRIETTSGNVELLFSELSCLLGGSVCGDSIDGVTKLVYDKNSIKFLFSAPFYEESEKIQYSFYLEGYDENWWDWSFGNEKEYTNLPPNKYTFRLKARNVYQIESKEIYFDFEIMSPWYRTIYAYIGYVFLFSIMLWCLLLLKRKQFEREKHKLIIDQEQFNAREKEKHELEKINFDLQHKNKELASSAMQMIHKNEKISEIKNQIVNIEPLIEGKAKKEIKKIVNFIEKELNNHNWEEFELRFNQANNNFIQRFKESNPKLTHIDLKICAYLRMNLSTKEIANLLIMSVRGVETARYRIRKRIGLNSEINLTKYIIDF